jgi:hypothetical protein
MHVSSMKSKSQMLTNARAHSVHTYIGSSKTTYKLTAPLSEMSSNEVSQVPTGKSMLAHRKAALAELDEARFSWAHVRICLVAGESPRYAHADVRRGVLR